ncbi:MAG: CsgG/HfaB family protein [Desulfobacterales bacterium]|nr:CsgG/HfaB family protein [Desulfobacterales bacterium]
MTRLILFFSYISLLAAAALFSPEKIMAEEFDIPLGPAYQGSKCMTAVADFAVEVPGAPQEIGNGLKEMLQTALFDSNYFALVDRSDPQGISAEHLLSDSFMADPDAILEQGQMDPAETLIYGTLTHLEGGGAGLRVKAPWVPLKLGGSYHNARAVVDIRVVDAASGRVIAAASHSGSAKSGSGAFGAAFRGVDMPVELEMFKNTPLELCIRDCIYRSVVDLCKTIPPEYFRH